MSWQATFAHRHRRIEIERPAPPMYAGASGTFVLQGDPLGLAAFGRAATDAIARMGGSIRESTLHVSAPQLAGRERVPWQQIEDQFGTPSGVAYVRLHTSDPGSSDA